MCETWKKEFVDRENDASPTADTSFVKNEDVNEGRPPNLDFRIE